MGIGKVFVNNKPESNTLGGILPLAKGGTGSSNNDGAANQLSAIDLDRRNAANGAVGLNEHRKIYNDLFTEETWDAAVSINGPVSVVINSNNTYTIGRYSTFNEYNVSVSAGSVSRVDGTITFIAPSSPQTAIITLNGRQFSIDVTPSTDHVNTPGVVSPVAGAANLGPDITFTGSSFGVSGGSDTHEGSDWQLATDAGFASIVASVTNSASDKTNWTVTGLPPATQYYVRTRYKGTGMGYSNWSTMSSFTTKNGYVASTEQAKLVASDGAASDQFGWSVSISADGAYAVIGAYADDAGATNQGSAYIFVRSGTSWTQQAKLVASDGAANDLFGLSVSISADGAYAVIGAYTDDAGATNQGSAYIFVRSGTSWTQQAKLVASDGAADDRFGCSVSISADGAYAAIGAFADDAGANSDQGSAYIFVRSGTSWTQQAKLVASDGAAGDYFGWSVSISGDGAYAVIGARVDDVGANTDQGSAYIFVRSGTSWTQQAKLVASDGAAGDQFGCSVSISADGAYAAIGAFADDAGANSDQGSAYIFVRSGTSWTQQAKLVASDGAAGDYFGWSVSISGDGAYAVIGAYVDAIGANSNQGSAYIFVRSGASWTQQAKLVASDGAASDYFGYSVSISADGAYAVIGAYDDDAGANTNQGSAYIFA
jgi:hypothetical protein